MDLLWAVLLLVLVGSEAQNITEVKAELGQDVNLTCTIYFNEIFWYLEVYRNLRAGIGRTWSKLEPNYFSADFESKYVMSGNRLLIKNVSLEDSRLYYCGKKINRTIVYGDAFRLHSKKNHPNTSQAEAPATTTNSPIDCGHAEAKWQNKITPVSFSLNVFLALTLVFTCVCMKMRNSCCCRTKDSAAYNIENQEMQNPQYEEIQLPPTPVPVLVPVQDSSECIYYKAQHPNPKMPRY